MKSATHRERQPIEIVGGDVAAVANVEDRPHRDGPRQLLIAPQIGVDLAAVEAGSLVADRITGLVFALVGELALAQLPRGPRRVAPARAGAQQHRRTAQHLGS
jgi:hypothetical protein